MRVILDTNVLVSALLIETSSSARLIALWRNGRFNRSACGAMIKPLLIDVRGSCEIVTT